MPTFLSDPSTAVYAVLIVLAVAAAAMALASRRRPMVIVAILLALLVAAVFVIDRLVESPREEAERKIREMAAASQKKDWDGVLKHVSESFSYKGAVTKKGFRSLMGRIDASLPFNGVDAWEFSRSEFKQIDAKKLEMGFAAQPTGNPAFRKHCVAAFVLDADGQWRMAEFKLYDPIKRDGGPVEVIPELG